MMRKPMSACFFLIFPYKFVGKRFTTSTYFSDMLFVTLDCNGDTDSQCASTNSNGYTFLTFFITAITTRRYKKTAVE